MIGISNIAWTIEEEAGALGLLSSLGITSLELAPTRFWPSLDCVPTETARDLAKEYRAGNFEISSFQAILFGKPDLALFQTESRPALLKYLQSVADLCASMGARTMVFGAPKNRLIPEGMTEEEADETAVEFFRDLGQYAAAKGVVFGLEANPAAYGCNFCTHVADVARIVRKVDSPGLRWHLDSGELAMNGEDVTAVMAEHADLIGSTHISQPNLDSFAEPWPGHHQLAEHLRDLKGTFPIAIEMKRQPEGLAAVEEAVRLVRNIYG